MKRDILVWTLACIVSMLILKPCVRMQKAYFQDELRHLSTIPYSQMSYAQKNWLNYLMAMERDGVIHYSRK
jgi:flagellar motor switch protein FliG